MNIPENSITETAMEAVEYPMNNEHELRFYLKNIKFAICPPEGDSVIDKPFVPSYFITAVKLPSGAIELAVNNTDIVEKIDYILSAYDENMRLKVNPNIEMIQLMVV